MSKNTITPLPNAFLTNLDFALYQDGKFIVAYCPALQLSAYGRTELTARRAMKEMLQIYFEETASKGTLEKDLIRLGWILQKQSYTPPSFPTHLFKNLTSRNKYLNVASQQVSIPTS